jgi:hypothetical protein
MSFGHPSRVADAAAFCIVALFGAACTRAIEGAIRYADKTLLRRLIDPRAVSRRRHRRVSAPPK